MKLTSRERSATVNLALNRLEGRELPSATIAVVGTKLTVTGDAAANNIAISDDGRGNVTATVATGTTVVTGGGKGIGSVEVNSGGGDDLVDYRLTRNMLVAEDLDFDMGAGNDRIRMDLYRGVTGVPLNIAIDEGAGNDSADVRFGNVTDANVHLNAKLGTGNDTMSLVMFSGLSGTSHATFDVAGNAGADRVDFNVMGKIDASATLDFRSSNVADADDRLMIRYKGELDGSMNVTVDKSALNYGVQGRFALDGASTGTLHADVTDAQTRCISSAVVTDHTTGQKVTVLDRLGLDLTEALGMKVSK